MAKRFTDSEKWRKPWFRGLPRDAKLAWTYLTDNCDHAGIWPAAFDLMSSDLGFEVNADVLFDWFGDKLIQLSADKFFLPGYIEFQYGELKEDSKPHLSVIKILEKAGIHPQKLTLCKGYSNSSDTIKDKDKEKNKAKKKEKGYSENFEKFWAAYPRHTDKADAFRAYESNVAETEIDDLLAAVKHYRLDLIAKGTEAKYVKHPATFLNKRRWADWKTPPKSEDFSQSAPQTQTDTWESAAQRVLTAIKKAGGGSGAYAEREQALGPELHALAVRAGIQRIRDVRADGFALKTIAQMLRAASETGGEHATAV